MHMLIKKFAIGVLGIGIVGISSACMTSKAAPSKETLFEAVTQSQLLAADEEDGGQEQEVISIDFEHLGKCYHNDAGILLLETKFNLPQIRVGYSNEVMTSINNYYKESLKQFNVQADEYYKAAIEDYNSRTEEQKGYWGNYYLANEYEPKRIDEIVASMFVRTDVNTGSAHPNSYYAAQNFDAKTGKLLTFKDIVNDAAVACTFIEDYILQQTKTIEHPEYLLEGYEDNIKDILQDDTWYFSDRGVIIIANEYIITPHAVGRLEFTIPYSEFKELKPEYKL